MKKIFSSIIYLAKYNLPLRGHREVLGSNSNNGALLGLIELQADLDPDFKKSISSASKNCTYLSPKIQNQVIEVTSDLIVEKIIKYVNASPAFVIQFDETTDKSGTSQICFVLRYESNNQIKESFVGFRDAYASAKNLGYAKLEAKALAAIVIQFMDGIGLDKSKCVGICTDTCNLMTGSSNGTFVELKKKLPHISHFLCLNHITNLALIDSFKISPEINDALQFTKDLNSFFCSAKRISELDKFLVDQKFSKLKAMSFTRWTDVFSSSYRIVSAYSDIHKCLIEVSTWDHHATSTKALSLLNQMEAPTNIYSMCVINHIS